MTTLSNATVDQLAIDVPQYPREHLSVGMMHLGLGAFHRAHQAMYTDRLLAGGSGWDWAIESVGVLPINRDIVSALNGQDGLYTLVLKYPDGRWEARVIGSILRALLAPSDPTTVIDRLSDRAIRIVTMTITEGGYLIDNATGHFCADDPAVQADLAPGARPGTAFGYLAAALARRRATGTPPPVILSCDNVFGNGEVTRNTVVSYTQLSDPSLAEWIAEHVHFPNCMVDRITPALGPTDRAEIFDRFGVEDAWPVICEPYVQWVVEDDFPTGRPDWESVGVQMVPDVRPYELMKLRLLNAGHQLLAHPGALAGLTYVHQAAADGVISAFLDSYYRREAIPVLPPTPGIDAQNYCQTTVARFANPHIADTLDRIRAYASDRIPTFVLPTVRANLAGGGPVRAAAVLLAAWGICVRNRSLTHVDLLEDSLRQAADQGPQAFLAQKQIFAELGANSRLGQAVAVAWNQIEQDGVRAAMRAAMA